MSLCIRLPISVQIGPSLAELCYIDFQDGGRCGAILLPVSDQLMSIFLKGQFLAYQQTTFRGYNSIHSGDITISGLE